MNPNCDNAGSPAQQQLCNEHGHYRPSDSDTARVSQTRSTISYGKGRVALQYVADDLAVPGTGKRASEILSIWEMSEEGEDDMRRLEGIRKEKN